MSDIVEQARRDANYSATHGEIMREMANEIERLNQNIGALLIQLGDRNQTISRLHDLVERLREEAAHKVYHVVRP